MIARTIMLCGALLTLLAAVGVVRFPDALTRMHALTKASTVGFGLVAIGAAFALPTANDVTSVLLAFGLQLLTLPVAATLIANSTYWAERIPAELPADDELEAATNNDTINNDTINNDTINNDTSKNTIADADAESGGPGRDER